jgi:ABC-type multidrug transport system fused ATPase/permease subunit
MNKTYLKRYSLISVLTFFALSLSFLALDFQGKFVELIASSSPKNKIYLLVILYVVFKTISSVLQIYRSNLISYFSNKDFLSTWNLYLPIFQDQKNKEKSSEYFNSIYNLLPQVANIRLHISCLASNAIFVFGIFIYMCFNDQIYFALLLMPILVASSYLSNNLFQKQYSSQLKNLHKNKSELMDWVSDVFSDAKSVKYNWTQSKNIDSYKEWHNSLGSNAYKSIHDHLKCVFKRSWVSNVTVDWVYFAGIGGILFLAVHQGLPIAKVVFWTGLADYLINANRDIYKIFDLNIQRRSNLAIINDNLGWIHAQSSIVSNQSVKPADLNVKLLDGSDIEISFNKNVNYIKGENGSGKSTLSNSLIGFNQTFDHWNVNEIEAYAYYLCYSSRTIENNPTVYKCFDEFADQVFGFTHTDKDTNQKKNILFKKFENNLNQDCFNFWVQKYLELEDKTKIRKNGQFSSGEKVILALFRLFSNLDETVKTIVVDECDSFLDKEVRKYFYESIKFLSEKYMIIYVSHNFDSKTKFGSYGTYVNIVGCSKDGVGIGMPVAINAKYSISKKNTFSGNLGADLEDVFNVAKAAVMHTFPQFSFLDELSFSVDCQKTGFKIGEARSAGLALALGILNICNIIHDRKPLHGIAASGNILLDGTIENVINIQEKEAAVKDMKVPLFLSPKNGSHLKSIASVAYKIS